MPITYKDPLSSAKTSNIQLVIRYKTNKNSALVGFTNTFRTASQKSRVALLQKCLTVCRCDRYRINRNHTMRQSRCQKLSGKRFHRKESKSFKEVLLSLSSIPRCNTDALTGCRHDFHLQKESERTRMNQTANGQLFCGRKFTTRLINANTDWWLAQWAVCSMFPISAHILFCIWYSVYIITAFFFLNGKWPLRTPKQIQSSTHF